MAEFMRKIHSTKQDTVCLCVWGPSGHKLPMRQAQDATVREQRGVYVPRPDPDASEYINNLGIEFRSPRQFPHHSHMAPSTPFYYLVCSLSSPPLTLFCQASESWDDTSRSNHLDLDVATGPGSANSSPASLGRIPVCILLLRTKSVWLVMIVK